MKVFISNNLTTLAQQRFDAGDKRLIGVPGFSVSVPGSDDGFRPLRLVRDAGDVIYPECARIKPAFVRAAGLYNVAMTKLHRRPVQLKDSSVLSPNK